MSHLLKKKNTDRKFHNESNISLKKNNPKIKIRLKIKIKIFGS